MLAILAVSAVSAVSARMGAVCFMVSLGSRVGMPSRMMTEPGVGTAGVQEEMIVRAGVRKLRDWSAVGFADIIVAMVVGV